MLWARMVAYVTGTVNQELLLRNEYLGAENRILRGQIKGRLLLSEGEKATLAEIAQRLGRKALEELAAVAKPDTLLAWYRKLIANKFDGSRIRQRVGRPRIDEEAERLVLQMAKENPSWGYDRIVGGSIKTIRLPARSPNLNSFAERWVRSVKEECLSKLILFGERSLRRVILRNHGRNNNSPATGPLRRPAAKKPATFLYAKASRCFRQTAQRSSAVVRRSSRRDRSCPRRCRCDDRSRLREDGREGRCCPLHPVPRQNEEHT